MDERPTTPQEELAAQLRTRRKRRLSIAGFVLATPFATLLLIMPSSHRTACEQHEAAFARLKQSEHPCKLVTGPGQQSVEYRWHPDGRLAAFQNPGHHAANPPIEQSCSWWGRRWAPEVYDFGKLDLDLSSPEALVGEVGDNAGGDKERGTKFTETHLPDGRPKSRVKTVDGEVVDTRTWTYGPGGRLEKVTQVGGAITVTREQYFYVCDW